MSCQNSGDFDLDERLRTLRESTRGLEAPQRVEAALLARCLALSEQPAKQWPRWTLAVAAAVVVAVGLFALLHRARTQPAPPVPMPPTAVRAEVAGQPAPPAARRVKPRAATPSEVAGDFIPLVPDLAWGPGEGGQILRVSMPRSALQSFGLPVDESKAFELVKADIVVGQDMVAHAIRIVR